MIGIGIYQMKAIPLQVSENIGKAEHYISKIVKKGAQLVVLPEMFNVGFSTNDKLMKLAEPLDGYTVNWLKNQAAKHKIYITTSIYERFEGDFYNTMVMVGGDRSLQIYRKRNPTCQERLVWKRSDTPGPGIFKTPFGRIGGAICFDSFSRETYEGFKKSRVELVVIVALWGTIRPDFKHPDTYCFNKILNHQSYLASEVIPYKYATQLGVPVVYTAQCGTIQFPVNHPGFYPFPGWPKAEYEFKGNSNTYDASGKRLIRDVDKKGEFCSVAWVDIKQTEEKTEISRINIPPQYMKNSYYFVEPPFMFKLYQKLCFSGFETQYDQMRIKEYAG